VVASLITFDRPLARTTPTFLTCRPGVAMRRYRSISVTHAMRERGDFVEAASDLAHVPELTVYEPSEPWQTLPILDQDGRPIQVWTGPDAIGFLARDHED
jgi:hypothetical protein